MTFQSYFEGKLYDWTLILHGTTTDPLENNTHVPVLKPANKISTLKKWPESQAFLEKREKERSEKERQQGRETPDTDAFTETLHSRKI